MDKQFTETITREMNVHKIVQIKPQQARMFLRKGKFDLINPMQLFPIGHKDCLFCGGILI